MKVSNYNHYPKWYIEAKEKEFKEVSQVVYRYSRIVPDPDNPGRELMPGSFNFKKKDYIQLPKDEPSSTKKDFSPDLVNIHIAFAKGETPEGVMVVGEDLKFHRQNNCLIILKYSKAGDFDKFLFMESINMNGSNPYRDASAQIRFYRLDPEGDAKRNREKRKIKNQAIKAADGATNGVVYEMATLIGGMDKGKLPTEQMRDFIEEFAESNPEEFLRMLSSQVKEYKTLIEEGKKLQIIKNLTKESKFVIQGAGEVPDEDLFIYKGIPTKEQYDELALFLMNKPEETRRIRDLISSKKLN